MTSGEVIERKAHIVKVKLTRDPICPGWYNSYSVGVWEIEPDALKALQVEVSVFFSDLTEYGQLITLHEPDFKFLKKYAVDVRKAIPAGHGYYHVFKDGKLVQQTTFFFEDELQDYKAHYPDRTLEKQEGEQVHKLLIKLSKDHEGIMDAYEAGYWFITEHRYQEMIDSVPSLGTSGGWSGRTGLRLYEGHFDAFKKFARNAKQQTLF